MEPQKTPINKPPESGATNPEPTVADPNLPPTNDLAENPEPTTPDVEIETQPVDDNPAAADTEATPEPQTDESFEPETSESAAEEQDQDAPEQEDGQDDALPPVDETPADPLPVTAPKGRKKGLIVGLVAAATFLLLSGAATASYYYYQTTKPENVLKQALANSMDLEKAKTVHFSGVFTVEDSESDMSMEATYKGAADSKSGAFDLSGEFDVLVTKLNFDARSQDGKTFYLRLGGLEGLPELLALAGEEAAMYAPMVGSIDGQWIEISDSFLKQTDSSYKASTFTEADIQKVIEAYLKYPFLVIDETLKDEVISGKNSHHYKLVVDAGKLKSFLAALKDANLESYKIDQEVLDQYSEAIDGANFGDYPFEVWIAKDSKQIQQVGLKVNRGTSDFSFRMTVDSYNKPVNVEEPEDAKSLLEIMGELFGGSLGPDDFTLPTSGFPTGISL